MIEVDCTNKGVGCLMIGWEKDYGLGISVGSVDWHEYN